MQIFSSSCLQIDLDRIHRIMHNWIILIQQMKWLLSLEVASQIGLASIPNFKFGTTTYLQSWGIPMDTITISDGHCWTYLTWIFINMQIYSKLRIGPKSNLLYKCLKEFCIQYFVAENNDNLTKWILLKREWYIFVEVTFFLNGDHTTCH